MAVLGTPNNVLIQELNPETLQYSNLNEHQRNTLVEWISEVVSYYDLKAEILIRTMFLVDSYQAKHPNKVSLFNYQLLGSSALMICVSSFGYIFKISPLGLPSARTEIASLFGADPSELLSCEMTLAEFIREHRERSSVDYLIDFLVRVNVPFLHHRCLVETMSLFFLEASTFSTFVLRHHPQVVALSALSMALSCVDMRVGFPNNLSHLSTVHECCKILFEVVACGSDNNLIGTVKERYCEELEETNFDLKDWDDIAAHIDFAI